MTNMRLNLLTRIHRRIIVRHFGNLRSFLVWLVIVVVCVYILDCCILTKDRIESLLGAKQISQEDADEGHDLNILQLPSTIFPSSTVVTGVNASRPPPIARYKLACGLKEACPKDQYPYLVKSGYKRKGFPTICFNGKYIIDPEKKNADRGLNVVVLNDKTLAIEDIRTFDVYEDDTVLLRYLKLGIQDHHLILVASQDEASYHLSQESKHRMEDFGSSLIQKIKFRDSFVMFGQRGLSKGKAIEKLWPRKTGSDFSDPVQIEGCVSIPMGELVRRVETEPPPVEQKKYNPDLTEGTNCGVKEVCAADAFSARLFTGNENKEFPKICINGRYVMAEGINEAGRGLNIVVVNPKSRQVIRVGHFDTFLEDSSNLEIFLEVLGDQDIILVVAFDEASTKLSDHARSLFNEVGSAMVQNVKFRDNWVFVGQKGISGFGEIEQVESSGKKWPAPIDKRVCVPTRLKGSQIKPDPIAAKNDKRQEFCKQYDGYGEFCDSTRVNEVLTPAPLSDKTLENHAIFQIPILVVPGLNFNALRMQLETLLMNPGMHPEMVVVMHDENFPEPGALADLFNFKTKKLPSSTKYIHLFHKALETIWNIYPKAKFILVLEEEVIPTQDFLSFHAQCLSVLESDETLIGVSAWNENGYEKVSTIPSLAYRTKTFPGLGFLLRKSFYDSEMKGKLEVCCENRTWNGWLNNRKEELEMIIPDVSRVYRRPYEGSTGQLDLLQELLNRPRATNLDMTAKLVSVEELVRDKYEDQLMRLISASHALHTSNVDDCFSGHGLGFYIPETTGKSFSIYFEQDNANDERLLSLLCKCFGLFHAKGNSVRGTHRGLIRFSYRGNLIFLVGSSTAYYRHMPDRYEPVLKKHLPQT